MLIFECSKVFQNRFDFLNLFIYIYIDLLVDLTNNWFMFIICTIIGLFNMRLTAAINQSSCSPWMSAWNVICILKCFLGSWSFILCADSKCFIWSKKEGYFTFIAKNKLRKSVQSKKNTRKSQQFSLLKKSTTKFCQNIPSP